MCKNVEITVVASRQTASVATLCELLKSFFRISFSNKKACKHIVVMSVGVYKWLHPRAVKWIYVVSQDRSETTIYT